MAGWIGGLVVMAIGLFAGHRYDDLHAAPDPEALNDYLFTNPGEQPQSERPRPVLKAPTPAPHEHSKHAIEVEARSNFARHVTTLFAELARADGEVVRDEVRVI